MRTKSNKVAAIAVSDLHLTDRVPSSIKSIHTDGYRDMLWENMKKIKNVYEELYKTNPGICLYVAGDVFDDHTPSLSCFAKTIHLFRSFIRTSVIYGQHDLRHHNLDDTDTGFFWMLPLTDFRGPRYPVARYNWHPKDTMKSLRRDIEEFRRRHDSSGEVFCDVILHRYCHLEKNSVPGMNDHYAYDYRRTFSKCRFVVIGDNHTPFYIEQDPSDNLPTLINCGGIMPRSYSERKQTKYLWILLDNGEFYRMAFEKPQLDWWKKPSEVEVETQNNDIDIDVIKIKFDNIAKQWKAMVEQMATKLGEIWRTTALELLEKANQLNDKKGVT